MHTQFAIAEHAYTHPESGAHIKLYKRVYEIYDKSQYTRRAAQPLYYLISYAWSDGRAHTLQQFAHEQKLKTRRSEQQQQQSLRRRKVANVPRPPPSECLYANDDDDDAHTTSHVNASSIRLAANVSCHVIVPLSCTLCSVPHEQ